jgi:hypothetical protein
MALSSFMATPHKSHAYCSALSAFKSKTTLLKLQHLNGHIHQNGSQQELQDVFSYKVNESGGIGGRWDSGLVAAAMFDEFHDLVHALLERPHCQEVHDAQEVAELRPVHNVNAVPAVGQQASVLTSHQPMLLHWACSLESKNIHQIQGFFLLLWRLVNTFDMYSNLIC